MTDQECWYKACECKAQSEVQLLTCDEPTLLDPNVCNLWTIVGTVGVRPVCCQCGVWWRHEDDPPVAPTDSVEARIAEMVRRAISDRLIMDGDGVSPHMRGITGAEKLPDPDYAGAVNSIVEEAYGKADDSR